MKAIISSTYDAKYLFFLPICVWAWNKIGIDVICFVPYSDYMGSEANNQIPAQIMRDSLAKYNLRCELFYFKAPDNKKSTYSQCARLYGACLDLPEDEVLITSDVDMSVFGEYLKQFDGNIQLFGADLLEGEKMYPMCYCSMTVKQWREVMRIDGRNFQQCLDDLLGHIEADHFRGNFWCKDQETLFNDISTSILPITKHNRAKLPERFATNRLDREDSYLLERDVTGVIDYHMNRNGYDHIETILTIFEKIYPDENFNWIRTYTEEYKKLL